MSEHPTAPAEETCGESGILADEAAVQEASGSSAPARTKRSKLRPLMTLGILVAGVAWVVHFALDAIHYEKTDDAYIIGHVHRVSAGVSGQVLKVLVDDNEEVKAGQTLAEIDPLEFEIMLQKIKAAQAQADAREAQAMASLDQAKADVLQIDAQIASADAQVKQIEAQLELANVNHKRNSSLYRNDTRAVSAAEVDTTKGIVAATSATLEGARASLAAAEAKKKTSEAAVEVAHAEIKAAKANTEAQLAALREVQRQYDYTRIIAPSDGYVGNRNIETGNRIQANQPVFALVERDVWVVANFKETQLKSMKSGQEVEIEVDALEGRRFKGRIDSVSPSTGAQFALLPPDNATGNFTKVVQRVPVKILFDAASVHDFNENLRPGLSVIARVKVK